MGLATRHSHKQAEALRGWDSLVKTEAHRCKMKIAKMNNRSSSSYLTQGWDEVRELLTIAPEAVAVLASVAKVAPAWNSLVETDAHLVARTVHKLHRTTAPHTGTPADVQRMVSTRMA